MAHINHVFHIMQQITRRVMIYQTIMPAQVAENEKPQSLFPECEETLSFSFLNLNQINIIFNQETKISTSVKEYAQWWNSRTASFTEYKVLSNSLLFYVTFMSAVPATGSYEAPKPTPLLIIREILRHHAKIHGST